jgi:hypothetical protein
MFRKLLFSLCILLITCSIYAQQENVPIDHDVYTFLKEMSVKRIIADVHDDNPSMSRAEVKEHLKEISAKSNELSQTEKNILKKYQDEFYDEKADSTNTYQMFKSDNDYSSNISDFLSDKIKYVYTYKDEGVNFYMNLMGRAIYGAENSPNITNTELFDGGFRFRGTLLDNLGYYFSFIKGGIEGNNRFAAIVDPRLNYNFKYVENFENIGNYDFTEGYLRYHIEPFKKMDISFEIGREKMKFGYGYGDRLILSGNSPLMDFIKLDFKYGVFSFSSWTASTVGEFDTARANDYTKYIATNQFKLSFKNMFDFGIGESIVYSGRGIDLAYINPLAFLKFTEMSIQDRDNATAWLELQTHFLKNIEFQGTFFIDDDPLGNLQDMNNYINKTAYQLGIFWYSPFSISDLTFVIEYTRIRPYVYSNIHPGDTYTAWGQILGDQIGPNSDEILLRAAYNVSSSLRMNCDYQFIRHGDNIYDAQGNLIFNSGGDVFITHRDNIDPIDIKFLSGERINTSILTLDIKYEPIRKFFFDLLIEKIWKKDITMNVSNNTSYSYLTMTLEF